MANEDIKIIRAEIPTLKLSSENDITRIIRSVENSIIVINETPIVNLSSIPDQKNLISQPDEHRIYTKDTAVAFVDLIDAPSTYSGQAAKVVAVKIDESGLEFINSSDGGTPLPEDDSFLFALIFGN